MLLCDYNGCFNCSIAAVYLSLKLFIDKVPVSRFGYSN